MPKFVSYGNNGYVSSQFDKSDTNLANVTGLQISLVRGRTYHFRAVCFVLPAAGGQKWTVQGDGTLGVSSIKWSTIGVDLSTGAVVCNLSTSLGGTSGWAVSTNNWRVEIEGTCVVNAGDATWGNVLSIQFAQNAASGTSSVLVGSFMEVTEVI